MRTAVRGALAVAVALAAVAGVTTTADADKDSPVPSQTQVDRAAAEAVHRAGDVASIRAALVQARATLEAAAEEAEVASEAFNGAQWRLSEAKQETAAARVAADAAAEQVEVERAALARLATQSYQNGTPISGLTVFFSSGGPEEVMDEVGVTQSAATTMASRYEDFQALDFLARSTADRAEQAQQAQADLVEEAARLRNVAAAAAQDAQSQAASIAARRRQLVNELAEAQNISVRLALRRQDGLERIAQRKAAAAAAAKARAEALAAEKDRDESKNETKNDGAPASPSDAPSDAPSDGPGDGGSATPLGTSSDAARAIRYARAQLGEPYQWAAAGPGSWDCSGLTMMAWRSGGVSLPHYSAAQYDRTKHIGVGDLRPGDLVFWGDSPSSIHHVALYIGDGQILHAPRTGRPVAIDSMYYWVPPNYFGRP